MKRKELIKLNRAQAEHVFKAYYQQGEASQKLVELLGVHEAKIIKWTEDLFPWSYFYELPFEVCLAIFAKVIGMWDIFVDAAKEEDPQQYILDAMEKDGQKSDEEIKVELEGYNDTDKGIIFSLFKVIEGNIKCVKIKSCYLNDYLQKGLKNDDDLLDAIMIDRSLISAPSVAKRIQFAVAKNDESFLTQLSKAIKKDRPLKIDKTLDDTRFMFKIFEECGVFYSIKPEKLYDILTKDLKAYPGINGNTIERFSRFLNRERKSRT